MTAAWFAFQFLVEQLLRMSNPTVAARPSRLTSKSKRNATHVAN